MRTVLMILALTLAVATARADEPASSTELGRGHAAWLRGDFEAARDLFSAAIERGSLQRGELLDAYVSLGAACTVLGQKDRALAAFRNAAIIDENFHVPEEAGKKAVQLAESARKQGARIGQIYLKVDHPPIAANTPYVVTIKIDATHSTVLSKLLLRAESGREVGEFEAPSSTDVIFRLPATLASGSDVAILIRGLDSHGSEVVKFSETVPVTGAAKRAGAATGLSETKGAKSERPSKSFWSTPWPYVIGGAVLAGAGTAIYFWKFAPVDEVTISRVQVNALR